MRSYLLQFIAIMLAGSSVTLNATIRNVPSSYSTIQSAILASNNGDTVLVADGVYFENINFRGKGIVVASHFIIDSNLSHILLTVIDGSQPVHPDTASCVLITRPDPSSSGDTTAALIGFTIRNGSGTRWLDEHGAGTYREGGGVLAQYCSPRIMHNLIINNSAVNTTGCTSAGGGGIRCGDGNPKITNNVVVRNQALYGPGIVINYCGGIIRNNMIHRNTGGSAYYGGSAVWANSDGPSSKTIENNTIISNTASVSNGTGGILMWGTSCTLKNNILWGNTPTQLRATSGSFSASYNTIQNGYSGTGNLTTHPLFADSSFILSDLSPSIDAGDSAIGYHDPENPLAPGFAEWPSKGTLRNDQGVYGGHGRSALPPVYGAWILLNTTLVNFGTVHINDSVVGKVTLANKGINPMTIDSVIVRNHTNGVTLLTPMPKVFSPVLTDTLRICWNPAGTDSLNDTLLIYHSDTSMVSPQAVRITGKVTTVGVASAGGRPRQFELAQNYPNPFNPATTIQYMIPERTKVSLIIYNLLGQPVKTLVDAVQSPGQYAIEWNGTDHQGRAVTTGIYLYRLQSENYISTRKMILVR